MPGHNAWCARFEARSRAFWDDTVASGFGGGAIVAAPKTNEAIAQAYTTLPLQSNGSPRASAHSPRSFHRTTRKVTTPNGTHTEKSERQPNAVTRAPPRFTPSA